MGVLGIMRVGQYQAVKAFGDKPRLMTRKSVVALICAGPLAHRRKAASYTKATLNLLRNMLNIPPLLGGLKGKPKTVLHPRGFLFKNQPRPVSHFLLLLLLVLREKPQKNLRRKSGVFGLAARWKKISFGHSVRQFLPNWSPLLRELGKSVHIIRLVDCIACFEEEI